MRRITSSRPRCVQVAVAQVAAALAISERSRSSGGSTGCVPRGWPRPSAPSTGQDRDPANRREVPGREGCRCRQVICRCRSRAAHGVGSSRSCRAGGAQWIERSSRRRGSPACLAWAPGGRRPGPGRGRRHPYLEERGVPQLGRTGRPGRRIPRPLLGEHDTSPRCGTVGSRRAGDARGRQGPAARLHRTRCRPRDGHVRNGPRMICGRTTPAGTVRRDGRDGPGRRLPRGAAVRRSVPTGAGAVARW